MLIGGGMVALLLSGGIILLTRKNKNKDVFPAEIPGSSFPSGPPALPPAPSGNSSGFPIKSGSRGEAVRAVQKALIKAYGKGILPRYGADGIWGSETENALRSKNLPLSISQSDFQKITRFLSGGGLSGFNGRVVTRKSARVFTPTGESLRVPKGVVLGQKIGQFSGKVHFLSPDGNTLMVKANRVIIQ